MIRDDGGNGLWISHPDMPSSMHKISQGEYQANWVLHRTEGQQTNADIGNTFDNRKPDVVVLDRLQTVIEPDTQPKEFDMPLEMTDREAEKEAILDKDLRDLSADGDPVGGNEESVDSLETDRMDKDLAEDLPLEPEKAPKKGKK